MKKQILALSAALAFSAPVCAEEDNSGVYIGVKGGSFLVDVDDASDPTGYGALFGYHFGKGSSVEFEYTNSGSINVGSGANYYGSLEIETMALYYAYRSQGTAYFKVKGGVLQETVTSNQFPDLEEDETGLSFGVGGGVNMGSVAQLELEYTVLEADVSLLSLGLNLRF